MQVMESLERWNNCEVCYNFCRKSFSPVCKVHMPELRKIFDEQESPPPVELK